MSTQGKPQFDIYKLGRTETSVTILSYSESFDREAKMKFYKDLGYEITKVYPEFDVQKEYIKLLENCINDPYNPNCKYELAEFKLLYNVK